MTINLTLLSQPSYFSPTKFVIIATKQMCQLNSTGTAQQGTQISKD